MKVSKCEKFGYGFMVTQVAGTAPGMVALQKTGKLSLPYVYKNRSRHIIFFFHLSILIYMTSFTIIVPFTGFICNRELSDKMKRDKNHTVRTFLKSIKKNRSKS